MHSGESNLWKASKILLNQEINTILPLRTDAKFIISDLKNVMFFSNMLHNTFSHNIFSNPSNNLILKHTSELLNYLVHNSTNYVTPSEIKQIY